MAKSATRSNSLRGNKNAAGKHTGRKAAAVGAAVGAASTMATVGYKVATGAIIVKPLGAGLALSGVPGAVIGGTAGLVGYGAYKGIQHLRKKKKK